MRDDHPAINRFRRTRSDHSEETAADYCELIDDLHAEGGEARAVDLSRILGISQVTVGKTLQRLAREGYLTAQPYRSIFLTEKGSKLASASREKHKVVMGVLKKLGVSESIAEIDAEGMEHHLSDETLAQMRSFLNQA